ncbi:hypothetical protein [Occultella kanbiaonis]|uniref:hypothetical protein n=1 Tax=Occultella kanbiaonis TaxID=2675754 RepID=UPI0012B8F055|nr:hypothetical protein [Occultella kanbiaonis]
MAGDGRRPGPSRQLGGSAGERIVHESIAEYLAEAGIAAAPVTACEILLPEGVTGTDLELRTGAAMAKVPAPRGGLLTQGEVDAIVHAVRETVLGR